MSDNRNTYTIECRDAAGQLDFSGRQPEDVFGALTACISEDALAKAVFRHAPAAVLSGTDIAAWPAAIDPRWLARRRYW